MDEANAPLETPQQPAPQVQQPASQPAATAPEVNQQGTSSKSTNS